MMSLGGNAWEVWRRWLGWPVLLLLAAGSGWLLYALDRNEKVRSGTEKSYLPDYTVEDFSSVQLNAEGQVKSRLSALSLASYSDGAGVLQQPYLVLYKGRQPEWYIRAEQAHLNDDGFTVDLLGKTWIWNYNADGGRQLEIISSNVHLNPDKGYAATSNNALMRTASAQLSGKGMSLVMATRRMELFSQVRGQYAIHRTN